MKSRHLLVLMLIGSCGYVCAQSRNTPVDAGSLRGKRITNPLQSLDRQGLGWDSANQRWQPTSYSTQSGNSNYCAPAGGSTTTYTCNLTPALSSYGSGGLVINMKPDVTNTGASTLNVNSLGAKEIRKLSSGSLVAVGAGDLDSDYVYLLRYNGTYFLVESSGCATCVTTGVTLTSGLPVIGAGGSAVGIGTRSGNTTEYASVSGAKTASKQATFDASGNVVASAFDVGSANNALTVTRTSNTVLDFSAIAAAAVAIGSYSCGAISSSSFSVSSGTGTLWIGVNTSCALVVRHNIVGSCTGCTAVAAASGFDPTDVQLYQWTVTSDVLAGSGSNLQTGLRAVALTAGSNIGLSVSNGNYTISATSGGGGGFSIPFGAPCAVASPVDATAYYVGRPYIAGVGCMLATSGVDYYVEAVKMQTTKNATVKSIQITASCATGGAVCPSNETFTLAICLANSGSGAVGTCTNQSTTLTFDGTYAAHRTITGLSYALTAGDKFVIRITTPTWATNPTDILISGYLYLE